MPRPCNAANCMFECEDYLEDMLSPGQCACSHLATLHGPIRIPARQCRNGTLSFSTSNERFVPQSSICTHCGEIYLRHTSPPTSISLDMGQTGPPQPTLPVPLQPPPQLAWAKASAIPWTSSRREAGLNRQDHQSARMEARLHSRAPRGIAPSPLGPTISSSTSSPPSMFVLGSSSSVFDTAPVTSRSKPRSKTSAGPGVGRLDLNMRFIVKCTPPSSVFPDMEVPDNFTSIVRAPAPAKQSRLVICAQQLGLTFLLNGPVRKDDKVHSTVSVRLNQLLTEHDLIFVKRDGTPEPSPGWTFYWCKQANRNGEQALLTPCLTPWNISFRSLEQSAARYSGLLADGGTEYLVFIVPTNSIIAGWLPHQRLRIHRHLCLGSRLWVGFFSAAEDELSQANDEFGSLCWDGRKHADGEDDDEHIPGNCPVDETRSSPAPPPSVSQSSSVFSVPHSAFSVPLSACPSLPASPDYDYQAYEEIREIFTGTLMAAIGEGYRGTWLRKVFEDYPPIAPVAAVEGPSTENLASAIWERIIEIANGDNLLPDAIYGCTFRNFDLQGLHTENFLCDIKVVGVDGSISVGRGVWTAVWGILEKKVYQEVEHWQQLDDDGYTTIKLRPFHIIP
ncbi:hypothetical protein BT96DRAFT_1004376 [Gymnopus androsaceus JB14]|uniref:Uncharacterized protein n=1 Tax=Gymnopus androsaceus JB14 TaxID=1447944 RepID=A0A6A4GRE7_9AGAR|nr:hypothetical protein BT96DRAFT_1004376 [Gymnopus androsaceus JB14]